MIEHGLATAEEIAAGRSLGPANPVAAKASAPDIARIITRGTPYDRPPPAPARFKAGDHVRAKNMHPKTHTRLPRYVRGHVGVITRVDGATYSLTATPSAAAKILTGCTPCGLTVANCGAKTPTRPPMSRSRPGNLISSRCDAGQVATVSNDLPCPYR